MDLIEKSLDIIGSTEYVEIDGRKIPAKIDTGADSSAIWASNITMEENGVLSFSLFGPKSPYYTGERLKTTDYTAKSIRSSIGNVQVRYRIKLPITILGKTFETTFTLAERSRNRFPILIGRRTISGIFLVDVSRSVTTRRKLAKSSNLNQELHENPFKFHQKYINNKEA